MKRAAERRNAGLRSHWIEPAGTPGSGDEKLEFAYDYRNRCVRKLVYVWDPNEGESGDWSSTADVDLRFVYHQGLLLVSFDGLDSNARVHKFVWGPDQSPKRERGVNGAGGANLRHLLATRDCDGSTDYVCFNNGKNSVGQLVDRSDGSVDAKYVYDVRGDTVRNTGTYAADNPLRYQATYFHDLDYAGTDCDGLYCSATGDFYSPRLGQRVARPSRPLVAEADSVGSAFGNQGLPLDPASRDDPGLAAQPADLCLCSNDQSRQECIATVCDPILGSCLGTAQTTFDARLIAAAARRDSLLVACGGDPECETGVWGWYYIEVDAAGVAYYASVALCYVEYAVCVAGCGTGSSEWFLGSCPPGWSTIYCVGEARKLADWPNVPF